MKRYRYPVRLTDFEDKDRFRNWFAFPLPNGDRGETIAFENHFRSHAAAALESWYEVVFWKMFSQRGRANIKTQEFIAQTSRNNGQAKYFAKACEALIQKTNRDNFNIFHSILGYSPASMAITATFPAFMDPINFPMVDKRVAKWAHYCSAIHNSADPNGTQLLDPGIFGKNRTNLRMSDFDFYESWIRWCRYTADMERPVK